MDSKYPGGGTMVAKSLDFTISESLKNALFWIFYSPELFLKLNFALSLRESSWTSTWNNQRNSTSLFMASKLQTISVTIISKRKTSGLVDTGLKLNVHKTFRRCPGRLLNVLCTFNLRPVRPVSTGEDGSLPFKMEDLKYMSNWQVNYF